MYRTEAGTVCRKLRSGEPEPCPVPQLLAVQYSILKILKGSRLRDTYPDSIQDMDTTLSCNNDFFKYGFVLKSNFSMRLLFKTDSVIDSKCKIYCLLLNYKITLPKFKPK
jgi:hypothetical protein